MLFHFRFPIPRRHLVYYVVAPETCTNWTALCPFNGSARQTRPPSRNGPLSYFSPSVFRLQYRFHFLGCFLSPPSPLSFLASSLSNPALLRSLAIRFSAYPSLPSDRSHVVLGFRLVVILRRRLQEFQADDP